MTDLLNTFVTYLHDVFVIKFDGWVILGFVAQAFFTMRFVVQWIASERARKSVIPVAFWFFSIGHRRPGARARGLRPQSVFYYRERTAGFGGRLSVARAPPSSLCALLRASKDGSETRNRRRSMRRGAETGPASDIIYRGSGCAAGSAATSLSVLR